MCGIAARFDPRGHATPAHDVLARLAHRGPDAEGQWCNTEDTAWLGHRRLAIVDLSAAGQQPMHNEDKTIWLVCNGEIYNYPQLRKTLEAQGHCFYSNCDCEAILHAYEQWGDDCVTRLEGMFAFALWDDTAARLLAARDRIGMKPLFYAQLPQGGLALASEASSLIKLLPQRPNLDGTAAAYVMSLGYVPSPWSIWEGVAKLEPGHQLHWTASRSVSTKCYWQPPDELNLAVIDEQGDFEDLWQAVIQDHLLSDVPMGLFLSGGLDSSAVASCLNVLKHKSTALTVTFPNSTDDEGPIAEAVAKHLGIDIQHVPLQVGDVEALIRRTTAANDEPQGYSALLSMLLLCEATCDRFKVVFAGDGGDEVFGGYSWYGDPCTGESKWSAAAWRLLRNSIQGVVPAKLRRIAARHYQRLSPLHSHAWRLFPRFLPEEIHWLLQPQEIDFDEERAVIPFRRYHAPRLPLKRALQRIDLMTFCSDSVLAKVDRASMANSLEVRVPLLDRRVVEWGLSRPTDQRETTESKPTLREYLRPRVPAAVLDHRKQGFSLRIMDEFDWNAAIRRIERSTLVQDGCWNPAWKTLVKPGVPFRQGRIWTLLMLSSWADHWTSDAA